MKAEQDRLSRLMGRAPLAASAVAIAMGVLVLFGWLLDMAVLKSMLPGLTFMKVNTALGFMLSGISLGSAQQDRRIISRVCAAAVLLLGLLTLGEYLSGTDFGIDQLLIRESTQLSGDIPGRMAVNTALSFTALGIALLLLNLNNMSAAIHALAMIPIIAAGSALIGYGYDIEEFLRVRLSYTPMAANTAVVFVLLALGLLNAHPDYPLRRFITSDSAAGISARRLLPAALGFTLLAGWLIFQGYHAGYYGESFGLALFTSASVAGLTILIMWNAGMLYEADIQRKLAEAELRAASLYARSLLEASLDPLVTISAEGKITDVNEAAVKATGIERETLVGSDFSDYFTEPGKAREGYQAVFAKGFVTDYPLSLLHASGRVMEVLYNASVYRNANGEVAGVFAAARDITERKRAEAEVRTASLYARSLIEASLDPLVTISPEGKITDVNEAAVKATGIARDALIGSDFSDYFTAPDKAREGYQEVFAKGFVTDYPLSLLHASGRVMDVLYNASVYRNANGEVAGVFAAARDITERRRAEAELQKYHEHLEELVHERTSDLEIANKDLEGFAYSVSHDLRTPLRAIDGYSNLLLKRYPDKLDDEGKRYLNVVRDNTRKLSQLIDDILAFSRMGRLGMAMSEIDMEALAHEVFDELKPDLAGRELSIKIERLPPCRGDPSMLRQVWVNLLSNAIKFTRPRALALIEVGGHTAGAESSYYVKDNGAGFDMQYAEKLFGVFQRLHGIEEFEGTGIGLAIVKRIITRHGGRVWAEGRLNEGATIYFTLPS